MLTLNVLRMSADTGSSWTSEGSCGIVGDLDGVGNMIGIGGLE